METMNVQKDKIFQTAPLGIAKFNEEGKLSECNAAWGSIFECTDRSLVNTQLRDYVIAEHREAFDQKMEDLKSGKLQEFNSRLKFTCGNGNNKWIWLISKGTYDEKGNFLFRYDYVLDMDEYRSTVIKVLVHDVKNEINKIQLATALLTTDSSEEPIDGYIKIINESCDRSVKLLNKL